MSLQCQSVLLNICLKVSIQILLVAAFSNKSFSGKKSLPVKNPYLTIFPNDQAETLGSFHDNLTNGPMCTISEFDEIVTICLCH